MKKTIFAILFSLMILSVSVSAWHCADSDESTPKKEWVSGHWQYGDWGDNGLLGGTSSYWLEGNNVPEGCTGSQGKYKCNDFCDGTTLREFYCDDRSSTREKVLVCDWEGTGKNKHRVCDWEYKTVTHWGETVIKFMDYENSPECSNEEVPEFGIVAGSLAVVGALGIFVYRRK